MMEMEIIPNALNGKKYRKKTKNFSFAYESGYEALDWLDKQKDAIRGGQSAYLVKLLLEDKYRKTHKK